MKDVFSIFQDIVSKQKNGSNLIQIDVQFADIPFYIFGIEQSDYSSILRCMSRISGLEYKVDFDKSIRITRDSVNSNIVKNLKPSLIENKIIEYLPYSYRNYINFKKEELKNSNLLPIRIREDIKKFHSLDFNFISKQIVLNNDKGELYSNLSPDIKNLINNFIMLEIMKINSRYLMECPEYIDDVRNGELILKIRPDGSGTIQIKSIKSGKSVYYQGIARKK